MSTTTVRPASTAFQGAWTASGGGHAAVLADNSDSTYIQAATAGGPYSALITAPSVAAGAQIRSVAVRVRRKGDSASALDVSVGYGPVGAPTGSQVLSSGELPTSTIATRGYGTLTRAPGTGAAWTPALLAQLVVTVSASSTAVRVYEVYVDVTLDLAPTVVITSPVGTQRGAQQPTVTATYSDPEGAPCERAQAKVFTSAQAAAAGWNPFTSASVWDSGEVLTSAISIPIGVPLDAGAYRVCLRASDAGSGGRYGLWAQADFTMGGQLPAVPTLSAAVEADERRVALTVTQQDNRLSYGQSMFAASGGEGDGWYAVSNVSSSSSASTTKPSATTLAETFTGSNGSLTTSNTDLDPTIDSGTWTVSSNQATCSTGGGGATTPPSSVRLVANALPSSDHYAQVVINALASGAAAGVWLRLSAAFTGYMIQVTGWGQWIVERWAGSGTKFYVSGFRALPKTLALPATLRAEIQGSTIRVYLTAANDSSAQLLGEFVDTGQATGTQVGYHIYNGASGSVLLDNFGAGDMAQVVTGGSNAGTVLGQITSTAAGDVVIGTGGLPGWGVPVTPGETVTVQAAVWQSANVARSAHLDAYFDDPLSTVNTGPTVTTHTDGSLVTTTRNVTVPSGASTMALRAVATATGASEVFVWSAAGVTGGSSRPWSRGGLMVANLYTANEGAFEESGAGVAGWTATAGTPSRVTNSSSPSGAALQLGSSTSTDVLTMTGPGRVATAGLSYAAGGWLWRSAAITICRLGVEFRDATGQTMYQSYGPDVTPTVGAVFDAGSGVVALAPDGVYTVHATVRMAAATTAGQVVGVMVAQSDTVPTGYRPGAAALGYARVEYSDDGGATWGLVRGGPAYYGPDGVVVVYDYEAPSGSARLYRASTAAVDLNIDRLGGATVVSLASATASATLPSDGWWLRDPLVPERLIPLYIVGNVDMAADEPQDVAWPLGRETAVVSADVPKGEAFEIHLDFVTDAEWDQFEELRRAGSVLLLSAPSGRQWYVRLGQTRKLTWLGTIPPETFRQVTVGAVEVDRPFAGDDLSDLVTGTVWGIV